MKESVAVAKEADTKKGVSPTKSDNSIQRVRDEPERQLGSLRDVLGNIRRDGGTPSVESIATHMSGMPSAQRAPALLALQQTHGNRVCAAGGLRDSGEACGRAARGYL